MSVESSVGFAFNRTRQAYLATSLSVANTHLSRLRGLMCTGASSFGAGHGLWIIPCRGIHTFAMNFPIDAIYLDRAKRVVHVEKNLLPWRLARISLKAASVLELPANTLQESGTAVGDEIEIALATSGGNGAK